MGGDFQGATSVESARAAMARRWGEVGINKDGEAAVMRGGRGGDAALE